MKFITMILLAAGLLPGPFAVPARADSLEVTNPWGFYNSREFRVARPGARPVSNFFPVSGFRPVDPSCYSGVINSEFESTIAVMAGARIYNGERINIRRTPRSTRFPQHHRWEIWSDPFSMMGVTSTSEGGGDGTARVWLTVNIPLNWFRLVTDVRPRAGQYVIETTGPGVSNMAFEEFHFYMADHHYSYVDLSQLQAHAGAPEVQAALGDIRTLLSNPPPNVFMGFLAQPLNPDGTVRDAIRIESEEPFAMSWAGIETAGMRRVNITITCPSLVRQYRAQWGP